MALSVDTTSHATASPNDTNGVISWTHTVTAGANKLLVTLGSGSSGLADRSANTVKFNGVDLTLVVAGDDGSFQRSEIWELHDPPTGAAYTIDADFGSPVTQYPDLAAGAISFFGAATALGTGYTAKNTTANPSITVVDSANGDIVVSVLSSDVGPDSATTEGGTLIWEDEDVDSDSDYGAQRQVATGANTVASWTSGAPSSGWWVIAAVAVKATPAPYLNPVVWPTTEDERAVMVRDDFNRANGAPGSNYSTTGSNPLATIVSNQLQTTSNPGTSDSHAIYTGISWPNDQFVRARVAAWSVNRAVGLTARNESLASLNHYLFYMDAGAYLVLGKFIAGAYTELFRNARTFSVGDIIELQCRGSLLLGLHNGVLVNRIVDTQWTSGPPGVFIAETTSSGSSTEGIADDFEAGTFISRDRSARRIVPVRVRTPSKQSLVQSASVDGSATLAFPGRVVAGNILVACCRIGGGGDVTAVTDSVNGRWKQAAAKYQITDNFYMSIWYRENTSSGTPTVTVTAAGFPIRFVLTEFSGFGPNAKPFSVASAQADSGNANSGNAKVIEGGYAIGTIGYASGTGTADWSYVSGVKFLLAYRSLTGIGTSALTGNTADLWAAVEVIFDTDQVRTMPMPLRKPETRPARIVPQYRPSPWKLVQIKESPASGGVGDVASYSFDMAQNITPGNLLVVFGWSGYSTATQLINGVRTASDKGQNIDLPPNWDWLYSGFIKNCTGREKTVTVDFADHGFTGTYLRVWAVEFSGGDRTDPLVDHATFPLTNFGTGTDAARFNSGASSEDGCLLIGFTFQGALGQAPFAGTNFKEAGRLESGDGDGALVQYRVLPSRSTAMFVYTQKADVTHSAITAVFRPQRILLPLPTRTPSGVNWTKHRG